MRVVSLQAEAFRNLKNVEIHPSPTANIICGDNAQGKTNLLEAIWLFTGARSFRGSREADFIPHNQDLAGISITFQSGGREQTGSIRWHNDKKNIQLNQIKETSTAAFNGVFSGVIFSPDHLSLVKDGPDKRRQMIDDSLSQAYPKYNSALISYNKAMRQRNTLLKDISFNSGLMDMLVIWDEHIINYGSYICTLRSRYIRRLNEYSAKIYNGISGGKEEFTVGYLPSFGYTVDDSSTEYYKQVIKKELKDSRGEDIRLGVTTMGPHRDDLDIQINHQSARIFGSQGQQRSSILALKLAECDILQQQLGQSPIVMLDDVMSELDHHRRSFLLNKLEDKQVFITCCDTSAFQGLKKGKVFFIENGKVVDDKEKSL